MSDYLVSLFKTVTFLLALFIFTAPLIYFIIWISYLNRRNILFIRLKLILINLNNSLIKLKWNFLLDNFTSFLKKNYNALTFRWFIKREVYKLIILNSSFTKNLKRFKFNSLNKLKEFNRVVKIFFYKIRIYLTNKNVQFISDQFIKQLTNG